MNPALLLLLLYVGIEIALVERMSRYPRRLS